MAEANAYETRKANLDTIIFQNAALNAQSGNSSIGNLLKAREGKEFGIDFNEYSSALIAQAQALEVPTELINKFTEALQKNRTISADYYGETIANIAATYQEAEAWEIDTDRLNQYAQYLAEVNNLEEIHLDEAYKLALAQLNLEAGLKALNDGYEDWSTQLKSGLLDSNIRKTAQYQEALSSIKKAVQQLTNSSEEVSNEFFQEAKNLQLVENALTGNEEAIKDLQKALALDFNLTGKLNGEEFENQINNILNSVELNDLEIGAEINDNKFLNSLYDMMVEAGAGVDEIQSLFNTLGWEPEFERIPIESGLTQGTEVEYEDPITGEKKRYKINSEEAAAGFITVPTSKGAQHNFRKQFDSGSFASVLSGLKGSGTSGGGGGSEKEPEWENPYDKLYNITKQINSELRNRNNLERQYQRLLNTHVETGIRLKENIDSQIESLKAQNKLQKQMVEGRLGQINELQGKNSDLTKYAWFDEALGEVQIRWDLIQEVDEANNEELGKRIEDYVSQLEEWVDSWQEANDTIEDNLDEIIELQKTGQEEYKDLEDRVLDALIAKQQRMIDEQEKTNKAIDEANSALTDAISKNIEKMRQDRQNEEKEQSLAEKERRLAYLRQDTTGSNALEIKKLEKDLDKERQDYTDSLIDQSLNDLKEQNDAAAKQREKQIELMQSQLDYAKDTGAFANQATEIVREGLGDGGVIDKSSRMATLLADIEDVQKLSNSSKREWWEELTSTIAKAFNYEKIVSNPDVMKGMIEARDNGDVNAFRDLENQRNMKIRENGIEDEWPQTSMWYNYQAGKQGKPIEGINYKDQYLSYANQGNWAKAFEMAGLNDALKGTSVFTSLWDVFDLWYKMTEGGRRFATGGMANFTGPAWLDGTKSRPEAVLNATDTQNFIELRDVLSSLRSGVTGNTTLGGDWYFDIDINVDEIANDYDVDSVAARVKQSIYEEATYRNVNTLNFLK